MEFELFLVFKSLKNIQLKIAMYNRCLHFYGDILPINRRKLVLCFVVKTSAVLAILFLVILPETSIAAAPKYETAYACEGKTLTIECEPGYFINLIRANYGRFSITICNDHGNVEWSVNCMFPKSLKVLSSKCAHKQNCSVFASTNIFGDPCPGTHKYLEAHYQCVSASQTSTTTSRPSPPWLITNQPNLWSTSSFSPLLSLPTNSGHEIITSSHHHHYHHQQHQQKNIFKSQLAVSSDDTAIDSSSVNRDMHLIRKSSSANSSISDSGNNNNYNGSNYNNGNNSNKIETTANFGDERQVQLNNVNDSLETGINNNNKHRNITESMDDRDNSKQFRLPTTNAPMGNNEGGDVGIRNTLSEISSETKGQKQNSSEDNSSNNNYKNYELYTTQSSLLVNKNNINNKNNNYNYDRNNSSVNNGSGINLNDGDNNYYCGPTTARNLFWNITKAGEINVQPCPGGATGIAKWRCILLRKSNQRQGYQNNYYHQSYYYDYIVNKITTIIDESDSSNINNDNKECDKTNSNCNQKSENSSKQQPQLTAWHPRTPDLTQCRSLWLNNLEIRVNQRDSSLISIANDLSQVTSSKTLYGGDMLVTTKIIQTMSEKMSYDIETFPDQKQREAIIYELLHGVVKTGSNLLDISQQVSWLDLSFEDQMRVATSLLTGIEDNAFLLADTITRERNVVQKVKNILLSIRVLETRNISSNEIFPDSKFEQWHISDDRIELPRGALVENSEGGLVRIVFVAFDRLETILKPAFSNLDLKFSTNYVQNSGLNQTNSLKNIRILNSKVISASLGKGRHIQLSQPIRLILRHLKLENVTNPTCVFWNYIDHAWSEDGCYLEETNRTHTICMCNHLTNFAILMDIIDEHHSSLLSIFDSNMRILIYISIAVCLIFIIIAILTLKIFNGIFIKVRQQQNHQEQHQQSQQQQIHHNHQLQTHPQLRMHINQNNDNINNFVNDDSTNHLNYNSNFHLHNNQQQLQHHYQVNLNRNNNSMSPNILHTEQRQQQQNQSNNFLFHVNSNSNCAVSSINSNINFINHNNLLINNDNTSIDFFQHQHQVNNVLEMVSNRNALKINKKNSNTSNVPSQLNYKSNLNGNNGENDDCIITPSFKHNIVKCKNNSSTTNFNNLNNTIKHKNMSNCYKGNNMVSAVTSATSTSAQTIQDSIGALIDQHLNNINSNNSNDNGRSNISSKRQLIAYNQ